MAKKLTPAIDLLIPSATLVKDNPMVFFILLIVPTLLMNIQGESQPVPVEPTFADMIASLGSAVTPYMVAGSVLSLLFFPPLIYASWRVVSNKSVTLLSAFRGSRPFYGRLLVLLLCMSIIIAAGLTLFVLPGILLLRRFVLAPYFLVQGNLGIVDSLRVSARSTAPHAWSLYSIFGIIFLFGLLGVFGVVGAIAGAILSVLYNLALPLRFREIIRSQ